MKDAIFEFKTLVARVNPDTGSLTPPSYATIDEIAEDDSMGITRALSVNPRAVVESSSDSNSESARNVKNETVLWQAPSPWSMRSILGRMRAWLRQGNNRRSVILLLIVLSLAAVLLLTLKPKRPTRPSVSLMQSAAAEDRPPPQSEVEKPSSETAPAVSFLTEEEPLKISPPSEDERDVRLKDAVHALTEGRLDDALAAYRMLSAAHPDDPSFALTVQILGGKEGGEQ